jgi:hypothetical protein
VTQTVSAVNVLRRAKAALMLGTALFGQWICLHNKRRERMAW